MNVIEALKQEQQKRLQKFYREHPDQTDEARKKYSEFGVGAQAEAQAKRNRKRARLLQREQSRSGPPVEGPDL